MTYLLVVDEYLLPKSMLVFLLFIPCPLWLDIPSLLYTSILQVSLCFSPPSNLLNSRGVDDQGGIAENGNYGRCRAPAPES